MNMDDIHGILPQKLAQPPMSQPRIKGFAFRNPRPINSHAVKLVDGLALSPEWKRNHMNFVAIQNKSSAQFDNMGSDAANVWEKVCCH